MLLKIKLLLDMKSHHIFLYAYNDLIECCFIVPSVVVLLYLITLVIIQEMS